ncbi:MAG: ATP-binding cassette domain-containing protein [Deltaproteobacteria bacterium]|nr:ATP-binding cassette domain-containing protein [Deltaproteobacteria bacterium]MBW1737675.1 ATP-binding cassette domain-containing protein [Deltaproteobacteria bacterium]MBW1909371.1 ATP-binding cassette domain-containing protein [Deltaproteobacteria bacterium]MBW2033805.1 ATP-binding cassette domain-containing protein [Deltaproteobacteria bacterium]MBW2115197.1 ATP-binding cassette domain-containing protein [Deltaproteobacteria bacterium]
MLTVKDLIKDFGRARIINSAEFEVKEDEIVSLVGPNGAGKTTLVNLISGHIMPTSGKIEFFGRDITYDSPYRRIKSGIARNFQITNLFEDSTVLDNVRTCLFSVYGKINKGIFPVRHYKSITQEAIEILDVFGIADIKDLLPPSLSEGDKKILDTAMAFALKSRFLLLDEPTSGVATGDKFKVMDTIVSAIKREKMACMIIEHDMDIVSDYSDRVLVLSEGEVIADGKPKEVMEQDNVKEILFGVTA